MDIGAKVKDFMSYFTEPSIKRLLCVANVSGVLYFWIVAPLVVYVSLFSIIPSLFGDDPFWLRFHWWLFSLASLSMMLNYLLCVMKRSFYVSPVGAGNADELSSKGWDHCIPCQQYIPPRAHHCPVCKRCILKRDQHCFILGVCVGHFNQRYFLVFLFYAATAALHSALCFFAYLNNHFAVLLSLEIYNYLYPIATALWIMGYTPTYLYGLLTLAFMCLTLGFGCMGFFFYNFKRALRSQTSHEHAYRITNYNRGSQRNLEEVFGKYWWLAFLLPVPMEQTSDGVIWNKPKEIKGY